MFDRLANGWYLGMKSFRVLKSDKKLLVFPLLSGLVCLLVVASFILPAVGTGWLQGVLDDQEDKAGKVIALVLGFLFYFTTYFVMIFFNSALVACAIIRFNDGEPTLGDGLRAAMSRLPQILGWALVSGTVGLILRAIEENSEKFGKFIAGLLGLAWSVMTYFVVPVLVVEKLGPIAAFRRSAAIVRRSWGESLGARFGIGLILFLLFLVAAIPAILGVIVGGALLWIGIFTTVVLWIILSLVSAAVQVIITAVLYQFATDGAIPRQFDRNRLQGAFAHK